MVAFDREMNPYLLVECKAPDVKITEKTFSQISNYFSQFKAKYMVITNGLDHFCFRPDAKELIFESDIPDFQDQ